VAGSHAGSLSTGPNGANRGHLDVFLTQADGAKQSTPLAGSALGGTLGGTISARDGALKSAGTSVDQLAGQLATALNDQHALGFTPLGAAGGPLFDTSGAAGAAASIAVAITDPAELAMASAAGAPGDAGNAQALLKTESAPLDPADPNSKDVRATLSSIVSQFGSSSAKAKAFADQDGALKDNLTKMRDSYSGVSIDEEMITMQSAQRAYEAIAKVIQTSDQMMQTLLSIKS
jgi:flagellar hook-associated protein 1 FlgK